MLEPGCKAQSLCLKFMVLVFIVRFFRARLSVSSSKFVGRLHQQPTYSI